LRRGGDIASGPKSKKIFAAAFFKKAAAFLFLLWDGIIKRQGIDGPWPCRSARRTSMGVTA
jgi:hypothetical protein